MKNIDPNRRNSATVNVAMRKSLVNRYRAAIILMVLLTVVIHVASATAQTSTKRPPAPRRPNIIFILADDLGYGDLGCYGQQQIKTPNIDKLAEEGIRFTDAYAGSTVCAPSRAALMTGKHTGHVRIRGNSNIPLQAEDQTIAEILKASGYRTGCIGKWGLGNEGSSGVPGKKGFDEWLGYLDQVHAHDYYPLLLNRSNPEGVQTNVMFSKNENLQKGAYSNDVFTKAALNFIELNKPEQLNKYRSFFLFLPYTIPHANNELTRITGNGMEVPSDFPYTSEAWPQVEKNKAAMITRLDGYIGQIMDKLKALKIDDNTIIIFASDNGPHKEGGVDPKYFKSAGNLRGIKRDLYEGGIRIPFIVRWPNKIKPGTTSDLPIALWDFLPTAAEIARLTPPKDIDGISFLPTLTGKAQANQHEYLYWEFHEGAYTQAVRMGNWKAIRQGTNGVTELYNLKSDSAERLNVAVDNPQVLAKVESIFAKAHVDDPRWPAKPAKKESAEETPTAKVN